MRVSYDVTINDDFGFVDIAILGEFGQVDSENIGETSAGDFVVLEGRATSSSKSR